MADQHAAHLDRAGDLVYVWVTSPCLIDCDDDAQRPHVVGKSVGDSAREVLVDQDGWPTPDRAWS